MLERPKQWALGDGNRTGEWHVFVSDLCRVRKDHPSVWDDSVGSVAQRSCRVKYSLQRNGPFRKEVHEASAPVIESQNLVN